MTHYNHQDLDKMLQEDILQRKLYITNVLYPLCQSLIEKGGAIAIHAPFGKGKTIFCHHYKKYIESLTSSSSDDAENNSQSYKVAIIDASLHEYVDEPFVPIHQHIEKLIKNKKLIFDISELTRFGKKVLSKVIKNKIKNLPGGELADGVFDTKLDSILGESVEDSIEEYKSELRGATDKQAIVILIDELDRCRPSYALLFLERLKHYFSGIKNLLFVLMINRDRLLESISHEYGIKDPLQYLEKFFLASRDLPIVSREQEQYGLLNTVPMQNQEYIILESLTPEKLKLSREYKETAVAFIHAMSLNFRQEDELLLIAQNTNFRATAFEKYNHSLLALFSVLAIKKPTAIQGLRLRDQSCYKELLEYLNGIREKLPFGNQHFLDNCCIIFQLAVDDGNLEAQMSSAWGYIPFEKKARAMLQDYVNALKV